MPSVGPLRCFANSCSLYSVHLSKAGSCSVMMFPCASFMQACFALKGVFFTFRSFSKSGLAFPVRSTLINCLAFVFHPAVIVSMYRSFYLISQYLIFSHISSLPSFSLVSSKMDRFVTDPSIASLLPQFTLLVGLRRDRLFATTFDI